MSPSPGVHRRGVFLIAFLIAMVSVIGAFVPPCARTILLGRPPQGSSARPLAPAGPASGECLSNREPTGPVECPDAPLPIPSVDFASAFERGHACLGAGTLRMSSGRLVAVDPLVSLEKSPAFTQALPKGAYPVVLRLEAGRVALALLVVTAARPSRWELGLLPGENAAPGGTLGYPVDSGTGAYADFETASIVRRRDETTSEWVDGRLREDGIEPTDDRWFAAYERYRSEIPDLLSVFRALGYETGPSANACVDPETGANVNAFSSGFGDGSYEVWFGFAEDGALAAVVTDFQVLDFGKGVHPFIERLKQ